MFALPRALSGVCNVWCTDAAQVRWLLSDDGGDEVSVRPARCLAAHQSPPSQQLAAVVRAPSLGKHFQQVFTKHPTLWVLLQRMCCPPAVALHERCREKPTRACLVCGMRARQDQARPQTDTPVHLLQVWWGASVLEPREADGTWRIQYDEREGFDAEDAHVDFLSGGAPWALVKRLAESACHLLPLVHAVQRSPAGVARVFAVLQGMQPAQRLATRSTLLRRGRPC